MTSVMSKTIIYVNDTYCNSVDQLKRIMSNPQLIKTDSFRREILSLYRDGILKIWFEEKGKKFKIKQSSSPDDEVFVSLFKEIMENSECPNFHSDFSKIGEFVRCEIGSDVIQANNGEITIDPSSKEQMVRFVFKSFKADNNIRLFTIKDNDRIVNKWEWNWNDKTKGKEFFFEMSINLSLYEGKVLTLVEGSDDTLIRINVTCPEHKNIVLDDETLEFHYVRSRRFWVGKLPKKKSYKSLNAFLYKHKEYKLSLLSKSDIESIKKERAIWNKMRLAIFWIKNNQYYDSYNSQIVDLIPWKAETERHQCWIKVTKWPAL